MYVCEKQTTSAANGVKRPKIHRAQWQIVKEPFTKKQKWRRLPTQGPRLFGNHECTNSFALHTIYFGHWPMLFSPLAVVSIRCNDENLSSVTWYRFFLTPSLCASGEHGARQSAYAQIPPRHDASQLDLRLKAPSTKSLYAHTAYTTHFNPPSL